MLAANNTSLEIFENWTLRVRTPAHTPARVLLMLHGWAGDENSTWVFARNFPTDTLSKLKTAYIEQGPMRDNAAHGWVRAETA